MAVGESRLGVELQDKLLGAVTSVGVGGVLTLDAQKRRAGLARQKGAFD